KLHVCSSRSRSLEDGIANTNGPELSYGLLRAFLFFVVRPNPKPASTSDTGGDCRRAASRLDGLRSEWDGHDRIGGGHLTIPRSAGPRKYKWKQFGTRKAKCRCCRNVNDLRIPDQRANEPLLA